MYSFMHYYELVEQTYSFGCVMAAVPEDLQNQLREFQRTINTKVYPLEDREEKGFEDNFHVTVKYGLHPDTTVGQVRNAMKNYLEPFTIEVENASVFNTATADVLVLSVYSKHLNKLNAMCCRLPNKDKYPKYKAHLTIGYFKKGTEGMGNLIDAAREAFVGEVFRVTRLDFSPPGDIIVPLHLPNNSMDLHHDADPAPNVEHSKE